MWGLCSDCRVIHFTLREGQRSTRPAAAPRAPPRPLTPAPPPLRTPPSPSNSAWLYRPVGYMLYMLFSGRAFAQAVPSLESSPSQAHLANFYLLQALSDLTEAPPWPPSPSPSPYPFSFLHRAHCFIAYKMYNLLVRYYPSPSKKLKALRRQKSLFLFADVS